jgi:hypothetical protein
MCDAREEGTFRGAVSGVDPSKKEVPSMPAAKTYKGSCHCGKVSYEVTTDLANVISCNCSMCSRAGTLLTFVPAEEFKLLSGEDNLTDYRFNKHMIHHVFCSTCGIKSFARGVGPGGKEMRAINVRCLEDVNLDALDVKKVDGKRL